MSEPSQFYARIRLSRVRLDELLASAFPDPSGDAEVLGWLSRASYYGERWTLAALDFSENYDDFTAAVAVFVEAAKYKDLPGADGMLIYSYLFGDSHPSAALRIEMSNATFLSESETETLAAEADETMEALIAEGAAANPQEP
ncbi:MAG: hypothetical protein WA814_13850 [Candidatus Baltobacteraceae bacterium]